MRYVSTDEQLQLAKMEIWFGLTEVSKQILKILPGLKNYSGSPKWHLLRLSVQKGIHLTSQSWQKITLGQENELDFLISGEIDHDLQATNLILQEDRSLGPERC